MLQRSPYACLAALLQRNLPVANSWHVCHPSYMPLPFHVLTGGLLHGFKTGQGLGVDRQGFLAGLTDRRCLYSAFHFSPSLTYYTVPHLPPLLHLYCSNIPPTPTFPAYPACYQHSLSHLPYLGFVLLSLVGHCDIP